MAIGYMRQDSLSVSAGISGIAVSNSTTYTSGVVVFSGGANITLNTNAQTIEIVGGAGGGVNIAASNTTYTSGTVVFTGNNLTVSTNGQTIGLSVPAPVAQTAQTLGLYAVSNTTGQSSSSTFDARTISFHGAGIASVGYSNGSVVLSVPAPSASGVNIAASNTTYTSGTVVFTGNNLTVSTNGQTVGLSVAAPVAQTVQTLGFYAVSNTTGASSSSTFDARTVSFAGAGGASVGYSAGSIVISVPAGGGGAGTNTLGVSNLGNTVGTSGVVTGSNLQFVLAGGNNITLSQSINGSSATVTISAFTQSAESQTLGMSNLGNTVGTSGVASGAQVRMLFAGGNNITLSQSLNGASGTISISGAAIPAQTAESQTLGISNLGNTAGTSGVASGAQVRMLFAGGNNITLSQSLNGASGTITISAFAQTSQSNTYGMSNLGNTAGTSGVISGPGLQMLLAGGANITLSQSINGSSATVSIVGGAGGAAGSNTFGMSNLGNTAGTSGVISGSALQMFLAGGANITLSQSINGSSATVSIVGGAGAGGGVNIAVSNSTTYTSGTVVFSAAGVGISLSTNGQTISLIGDNDVEAVVMGGNTAGATASVSSGTLTLAGGNAITLSQNGNAITISGPTVAAAPSLDYFVNFRTGSGSLSIPFATSDTMKLMPLTGDGNNLFPGNITVSTLALLMTHPALNTSSSSSYSSSLWMGFYTRVNSTQLSLLYQVQSFWNSAANQSHSSHLNGVRWLTINSSQASNNTGGTVSLSFTQGGQYWWGLIRRTANWSLGTFLGGPAPNYGSVQQSGVLGASNATATSMWNVGLGPFWGLVTAQTGTSLTPSIGQSQMNNATIATQSIAAPFLMFNNTYNMTAM